MGSDSPEVLVQPTASIRVPPRQACGSDANAHQVLEAIARSDPRGIRSWLSEATRSAFMMTRVHPPVGGEPVALAVDDRRDAFQAIGSDRTSAASVKRHSRSSRSLSGRFLRFHRAQAQRQGALSRLSRATRMSSSRGLDAPPRPEGELQWRPGTGARGHDRSGSARLLLRADPLAGRAGRLSRRITRRSRGVGGSRGTALSHRPFLLVGTYPLARAGFDKVNGLTNQSKTASEPIFAGRNNDTDINVKRRRARLLDLTEHNRLEFPLD